MQGIEFQIVNDSSQAASSLEGLEKSLSKLKSSLGGTGASLNKIASGISAINSTLNKLNTGEFERKMGNIAKSIETLGSKTAGIRISSAIGKQLSGIGTAIDGIGWEDGEKITLLANGLRPLGELAPAKLTSFINQLGKLPEVMTSLKNADIQKFSDQMKQLSDAMRPFADEMNKVSAGFSAFPSRIQRLIKSTEEYNGTVRRTTASNRGFAGSFNLLKTVGVYGIFRGLTRLLGNSLKKSADYQETLNMFAVSMGDYGEEAFHYAQKVSEVMGIDPAEWMKNQGVFNTIISGFGVAGDKAAFMSKNLTQLGYDLSSYYNMDVASAMQKLQSGISGELEPLRRLGYDLSVARLQQEALNLGIEKSVSAMTQAEKAQLRYHAIMTQVTSVQGDMARTLEDPANMLRVLRMQLEQAGKALGDLFMPILKAILPPLIAFASALRQIIAAIAGLFGVEMTTPEWKDSIGGAVGGTGDIADNMGSAANSAKELKRYLAGFDELNVLPDQNAGGSGGGSGAGAGGGFDLDLPGYDFLKNAVTDQIDKWKQKLQPFVDWIKDNIKEISVVVAAIGAGLLAWKLTDEFIGAIKAIQALSAGKGITLGLILTVSGFAIEFSGIKDAIQNGLGGFNFGEIVAGGLLGTAGASILGVGIGKFIAKSFADSAVAKAITAGGGSISTGLIGAAVGGIVAGTPMFVTGVYDAIKNGLNWLNGLLIPLGSTMAGAGIGAIIGSLGGPIGAGIGALLGLAVGAVTDFGIFLYEKWDEISAFFSKTFGGLATWFDERVIQPVKKVFSPIGEFIGKVFEGSWIIIQAAWQTASDWFSKTFAEPVMAVFETVKNSVTESFKNMLDSALSIWRTGYGLLVENVIQPISNAFNTAWGSIVDGFSVVSNAVSSIAKAMFNGVISVFENMINSVINGLNWMINQFNNLASWGASIIGVSWSKISEIKSVSLPKFADGGFPSAGELFIAREAGPEMVGSIGRRTAVANNGQIVEGIASGVRDANDDVVTAIYAVAQQIIAEMRAENRSDSGKTDIASYVTEQQRRRARALGL